MKIQRLFRLNSDGRRTLAALPEEELADASPEFSQSVDPRRP